MMLAAYVRRQEHLARQQALHTVNLLAEAFGARRGRRRTKGKGKSRREPVQRVPASMMFAQVGREIH